MAIYYPPSPLDAPMQNFDENFTMHGVSLSVDIYLRYSGTLAEGAPVDLAAIGCLYPDGQQTISYVTVRFEGSNHFGAQDNAVPRFKPELQAKNALAVNIEAPVLGTISWSTQGSYYPSIEIHFTNGSMPIIENYQDDTHKLFVESYTVIKNQNNDRVIMAVEIVGVFFACEGGLAYMVKVLRRKKEDNGNEEATNRQETKTDNGKANSNTSRKPRKPRPPNSKTDKISTKQNEQRSDSS